MNRKPVEMDYKYLRAWNKMMGSDRTYSNRVVEEARLANAPEDAIYRSQDGSWQTFADITNRGTRELIEEIVNNGSYIR